MARVRGVQNVINNLNKELKEIEHKTLKGLRKSTIPLRRHMDKVYPVIPVDWGNLRASWFVVDSDGKTFKGKAVAFKGPESSKLSSEHNNVISNLKRRAVKKGINKIFVTAGFSVYYAASVHEKTNPSVNWQRPNSGPKFFESALRQTKDEIIRIVQKEAHVK